MQSSLRYVQPPQPRYRLTHKPRDSLRDRNTAASHSRERLGCELRLTVTYNLGFGAPCTCMAGSNHFPTSDRHRQQYRACRRWPMSDDWLIVQHRRKGRRRPHNTGGQPQAVDAPATTLTPPSVTSCRNAPALRVNHGYLGNCSPDVQSTLAPLIQHVHKSYTNLANSEFLERFQRAIELVKDREPSHIPGQQANNAFSFARVHHLIVLGLGSPSLGKHYIA